MFILIIGNSKHKYANISFKKIDSKLLPIFYFYKPSQITLRENLTKTAIETFHKIFQNLQFLF